jgi:tetratricopeptide (TPR) repeat protein
VNGIISLESYDSDFIITNGSRLVNKKVGERTIKVPEFYANGVAKVNLGFRFYDPKQKSIIDQFHFTHTMDWNVGGGSIQAAIEGLLNRNEALKEVSYNAGIIYGERISPSWFRVTRDYFRKSKRDPDLAAGARMMESNDWDRAIEALMRATEARHRKTRGRAAHNLAVVYEILGDLDQAKEWATTAWGVYKNKKSRDYGYILTLRIQERERLKQQLEE